jgi:hypothetical protein
LYKSVVASLDSSDQRRPFAQDKVKALEPRVPRLTLILGSGTAEDVTVRIAGMELSSASFNIALPIDPGEHTARASTKGGSSKTFSVKIKEGESKKVKFSIAPSSAAPTASAPSTQPEPQPATEPSPQASVTAAPPAGVADAGTADQGGGSTLGYVLTGAGGAVFLGGAVVGALVLNEYRKHRADCWDPNEEYPEGGCYPAGIEARENGESLAPFATIGLIAGAAIAGTGVMLLLLDSPTGDQVALAATVGTLGGTLALSGRF